MAGNPVSRRRCRTGPVLSRSLSKPAWRRKLKPVDIMDSQEMTREAQLLPDTGEPGFGVYVHWPFCAAKCPYCDFNSHVRHEPVDQARFVAAFRRELATQAKRSGGETVTSIFWGGGTPSLMEPGTVGAILDEIASLWTVADGAEITLEANPSSVE